MQEALREDVTVPRNGDALTEDVRSSPPDSSSTAFTSVNGLHQKPAPFPENTATGPPSNAFDASSPVKTASGVTQFHSHGWRPDDGAQQSAGDDTQQVIGKRKRTDPSDLDANDSARTSLSEPVRNGVSSHPASRSGSPGEHASLNNDPGRTAQYSPSDDSDSSDIDHFGPDQREQSPVERWNKGDPPPKPRPETEASLAASLQQFQRQTQQVHEAQQIRGFSPHNGSPSRERDHLGGSLGPSDDQYSGDHMDPKRRKRNFSNRTKTGCHTCRRRKKKCDETKPICNNCERGNFPCEGYGAKPPQYKISGHTRQVMTLQSKSPMAVYRERQSEGPPARGEEGRSYSHWGRIPAPPSAPPSATAPLPPPNPITHAPPIDTDASRQFMPVVPADPRRPGTAESWQRSAYVSHEAAPTAYQNERLPPKFPPMSLQNAYGHDQRQQQQQQQQHQQQPAGPLHHFPPQPQPLPPPHQSHPPRQSHLPPMSLEPWTQYPSMGAYPQQHPPPPLSTHSSRGSITNSGPRRTDSFHMPYSSSAQSQVEKDKMLRGQPYLHYLDPILVQERQACKVAVERYNKAAETTSGVSESDRAALFTQILEPLKRTNNPAAAKLRDASPPTPAPTGPVGSIADHSLVESPFRCEYGYNIHIGRECVVESGCYFQDAADIFVGHRVIVGHNVKLYCISVGLDANTRRGSQTNVVAGAIKIDDDVFIGADAVVMPFVTIGRGAVVGAGAVVTKDVEEHTVVAGNPAKVIRRIEGPSMARHVSQQIQRQQDKMTNWMMGYANSGFTWYTSA